MDIEIELRIAELLASRLCHDLVSPVGAVNNGMELLEEEPNEEILADAVSLVSNSARQASALLQFYRLAYGQAGYRIEGEAELLRRLATEYLKSQKAKLVWPSPEIHEALPEGAAKLLLNVLALAAEALPRGGAVEVTPFLPERGLEVTARGSVAKLRPESRAALAAEQADAIAALTPRSVQACFTALLARRMGGRLEVSDDPNEHELLVFRVPALRGNVPGRGCE